LVVGVAALLLNAYICTILYPRYHLEDRQKNILDQINLERRLLSHGWMGIKFYFIVLINHLRV
jgi:hypothetical protein